MVSPATDCPSFDPHEVVHGLDLMRNLLAIPVLSDQTRSFLSLFFTKIHDDWNKIDFAGVKKLESQLKICLKSPDVLKTLREASVTLSQTFHIDLPDYVHLADSVDAPASESWPRKKAAMVVRVGGSLQEGVPKRMCVW